METKWSDMDDAELNRCYQDARDEADKPDDDRNWTDDDIREMEEEMSERDC